MRGGARAERATAQSRIKRTLTMIGKRKSSVSAAQKRAKALFTAETKENVSVPSGSDFAPTPKGAWGAALIVEEKKLPKSHAVSQRASTRKQGRDQALPSVGEWAGCDSPAVEQHGRSAPDRSSPQYPPRSRSPRGCSGLRWRCIPAETPPHLHRLRPCRCGYTPQPYRNQVRQFGWDHEHTLLDEWNLAFNGSWPLQLCGKVFNNAGPGLEDGDLVEYTSQVTAA